MDEAHDLADKEMPKKLSSKGDLQGFEAREKYRQRRRKPQSPLEGTDSITTEINDVADLIPEIGNGYRWYDYPYIALRWLLDGWHRKLLPRCVVSRIGDGINYLFSFHQHDLNRAGALNHPHENVFVPLAEHVNVAGMWVVELFPPTELPSLEAALKRNGWDRRRRYAPHEEDNRVVLSRSRAGRGSAWWRLVDVVPPRSTWFVPDGVRAELPHQFQVVHLRAIQVGAGLTAVIAEFVLSNETAVALDEEWHREHEPILVRQNGRPQPLNRQWAAFRETQSVRAELHGEARAWLGEKLPGFFAVNDEPQLLLDLLLLDQFDPTREPLPTQTHEDAVANSDAYRSLGLSTHEFYQLCSPQLPKLVLSPVDYRMHEALGDNPTWTLWGNRDEVAKELGERLHNNGDLNRAIASSLVDSMFNLLTMMSVSEFLRIIETKFAALRDSASSRHGKFRPSALSELRGSFLTHSLNLATVRRDADAFWNRSWSWEGDAKFSYRVAPSFRAADRAAGREDREPIDFNSSLKERHGESFARLMEADRDYRDILSTVASLGASVDTYKLGRLALWIAFASLAVAAATVLFRI